MDRDADRVEAVIAVPEKVWLTGTAGRSKPSTWRAGGYDDDLAGRAEVEAFFRSGREL